MWSPAWLLTGEVPGGSWGRLLALSRSAQVEREAPALGEDFAATSALHLDWVTTGTFVDCRSFNELEEAFSYSI